jgi:eukaryotic-like serine/threonine-protein kinase
MAEHGKLRRERDAPTQADGGAAIRTPSSASGSSSSDMPSPFDTPTLVPDSGNSATNAPTVVPISRLSPADTPTLADSATPPQRRNPPRTQGFYAPQPVLEAGAILAERYEIVETLGEGGMGAVYKAKDLELDRLVALKVIRPELAKNPAIIDRFKQELLLSQRVTHRNVIRIYDLGEGDGVKFITMEFIEGQDLRSLIFERKKVAPEEAVAIMEQVCLALDAAHSVGVIHRDLKPQNIMRDAAGRILVMDFGLARTLEGDGMTQTGALVGTMEYMSPEQALAKELDQRSDIFSAGLIFYELLTGQMPFRAHSALASLIKRTQERARPISDHDETIPQNLSSIVSKCLEREPAGRYQSAKELLADLEAWQGKRAAGAIAFPSVKPWGQTVPWPWLTGAFAVILLAIGGYTMRGKLFSPSSTKPGKAVVAQSLAILPFHNASGDAAWDWLGPSLGDMLSTDVGQSAHLRTVSPDRLQQVLHDLRISPGDSIDSATLRRIAQFANADIVVSGQYVKLGDQIRIDATLQDLKRGRSESLKSEAPNQQALSGAVDHLAETIRQNLALSPDLIKELQAQSFKPTSTSVEALRDYNQGLQLMRQGSNLEALKRFQSAVKEDPQFALAYSRLGETYSALGYGDDAEQSSRQAVELSQSLPVAEKYLIEASHARIVKDTKKAIEAYENLERSAPDNLDVQFALGGLYEDQGDYAKARIHFAKVLNADPKNLSALLATGWLEVVSGNPQAGLDPLNQALTLAIEVDNKEQRAQILQAIGVAYEGLNKPDEALRNLQQAMDINRQVNNKSGVANSLVEIAHVQRSIGKPDAALASYNDALRLEQEIGDKKGAADTLIDMGQLMEDRAQLDKALQLYKQSLQMQREVGDESYQALCLNNIANVYLAKGQTDDALTYYQQALQLREKLGVPADIAETLHNLGEGYSQTAQYDNAMSSYMKALQLRRTAGDTRGAAVDSHGIGMVFVAQGRYGAAVNSLQDAVKGFHDAGDRTRVMAEILNDYASALALAGRGAEAGKVLDEAQGLARELKNETVLASILNTQGDVQFYGGDLRASKELYQQALQTATRAKAEDKVLLSRFNLARVTIAEGQGQAAAGGLRQLATQANGLGLKSLSLQCSLWAAEALEKSKDYAQARQMLEQLLSQSDKLGLRMETARIQFLLGTAIRAAGNSADSLSHYREAVRLWDEAKKEPGAQTLLQRADLKPLYDEAVRRSS